jgi:formamidopyrimidine-DNA glycosylase
MPELPEVETMVRGIRPFVEGRTIAAVRVCGCRCRPITLFPGLKSMARRSVGRHVAAVRRIAKRVVMELDSGDAFVIEPRMTGLMLLHDPPDPEHLRIEWRFAGRREFNSVWFWDRRGLGTVRLLTAVEFAELSGGGLLGPDALTMTANDLRERMAATRRPVKVALLDQRLVAGIGNLYASEILHVARIHPAVPAARLTAPQADRIHAATRLVLEDAIRHEGSTLGDGTYRNVLNQNGGYQNSHRVYDRADEPCPTCRRAKVIRIVQAQRSTFFCPVCQRKRQH